MPINTDKISLKMPLAGQDVSAAIEPDPNAGGEPAPSNPAPQHKSMREPAPQKETPMPDQKPDNNPPPVDPSQSLSPRSREFFKRLEEARNSYQSRAEKAEKELAEITGKYKPIEEELTKLKSALPPDLEDVRTKAQRAQELEKINQDLLARVETLDFEHSPPFVNWWNTETKKHLDVAKRMVPADKREEFEKLVMKSELDTAKISQILESVPEFSREIVRGSISNLESLKIQREEALANGSAKLRELRAHEKQEQLKAKKLAKAKREQITAKALGFAKQLDAFKPIEGDADHNNQIAAREALVRSAIAGELDEDTAITLAGRAFNEVHLREKVIPTLRAEIEKRDALIKQLQGASPGTQSAPLGSSKSKAPNPNAKTMGNPNELKSMQWYREQVSGK